MEGLAIRLQAKEFPFRNTANDAVVNIVCMSNCTGDTLDQTLHRECAAYEQSEFDPTWRSVVNGGDLRAFTLWYYVLKLDRDRYRYQKFISDLSGIDPKAHNNKPEIAIINVRDWLNDVTNVDFNIQSGSIIAKKYDEFCKYLPGLATDVGLKMKDLTYRDYCYVVQEWLNQFPAWKRF